MNVSFFSNSVGGPRRIHPRSVITTDRTMNSAGVADKPVVLSRTGAQRTANAKHDPAYPFPSLGRIV